MSKTLLLLGSSRKDGDTRSVADQLHSFIDFDLIDLSDYHISYYDYAHKNREDDFLELIQRIIHNYDTVIFATPVYWYAMSGILKVFFDRITDLLDENKELGRKIRGKSMAVLTSSLGDHLGENFWLPFIESAKYLGMHYLGNVHTHPREDATDDLRQFADTIRTGRLNAPSPESIAQTS